MQLRVLESYVCFLWMQPSDSMTEFADATLEDFDQELRQPC